MQKKDEPSVNEVALRRLDLEFRREEERMQKKKPSPMARFLAEWDESPVQERLIR